MIFQRTVVFYCLNIWNNVSRSSLNEGELVLLGLSKYKCNYESLEDQLEKLLSVYSYFLSTFMYPRNKINFLLQWTILYTYVFLPVIYTTVSYIPYVIFVHFYGSQINWLGSRGHIVLDVSYLYIYLLTLTLSVTL